MLPWPSRTVEQTDPRGFLPPHCAWPDCPQHHPRDSLRFHRHGAYLRLGDRRVVPRFRCCACGRTFSQQSFAFSYYLKRPELAAPIAAGLQAGSAHRQLARSLGCAPSTVTRLAARLGRHAMLLLARALEQLERIPEPIVYDDFESFFYCQEFAFGMGTPVGRDSWFVYGVDCAPHRRGGRRSPAQRQRGPRPFRFPRRPYLHEFRRMLDLLADKLPEPERLELITDGHPEYREGLQDHPARERFVHRAYANPERAHKGAPRSAEAIERDRQLFATDLLHSLMRHSQAHHRRETIAFGRRLNALLERGFVIAIWRNFVKGRSERRADTTTPAMCIGLAHEAWSWPRVLAQRLFPSRVRVPAPWMRIYRREIITPQVGRNVQHRLAHAF